MKNLINTNGVIKLQDNLTLDYGIYTKEEYIELSEKLDEVIGQDIHIGIVDLKTNKFLFNARGLLTNKEVLVGSKFFGEDYFVGDMNLSDVLWELTETKVRLVLNVEEVKIDIAAEDNGND